jgi:signal transduction histidine kinase
MQFKAPEDTFSLEFDGQNLFDLRNPQNYLSNEYFLVPISENSSPANISISARDTNQDIKFPKRFCLKFGKHQELRWMSSGAWFLRTGVNLYSAYFLLFISFFLIFSFWLRKSSLGLSLFAYSVVSCIYLISFSEYPRAFIDPVLATGGFHFPIRLLQDLCLVFVFYDFYQKYDSLNIIKILSWIYAGVIGVYALLLLVGVRDYVYYSRIIIIMAPLVAAPMAIGTWFAFKLKDPTERKILIPLSMLLLLFQINDLLVFWKLIDSYFMVRIYIPFIVGMTLFLYFKRMHDEVLLAKTASERQKIFKEFIHDVKSPLAVLRIFLTGQKEAGEHHQVIQSALDRIEGMVTQVDSPVKGEIKQKIPLMSVLSEIVAQKNIEYPGLDLKFEATEEVFTFADKSKLQRIFSNIINNAYEAYEGKEKMLDIGFLMCYEEVRLRFTDRGKGIPKAIYNRLLTENLSTKENGTGIGLNSAYKYITNLGGELNIISKENFGTTIEIKLNSVPGNFYFNEKTVGIETTSKVDLSSLDFILIDDDKYIRLSWEYYARNSKKEIKTFSSVDDFLELSGSINKECPIYLDLNMYGEKSTKYIDQIYDLGFINIILATGEDLGEAALPNHVQGISGKLPPLQ